MVKQTKTFKKGNVTKKALSAILAASMVMTSSSFVMAAPVEVEDVAVEAAAVAEDAAVADVVEDVDAGEESVGAEYTAEDFVINFAAASYNNGKAVEPTPAVTYDKDDDGNQVPLTLNTDYTVTYSNNVNAGKGKALIHFTNTNISANDIEVEFTISPVNISTAIVKLGDTLAYIYDGTEKKPEIKSVEYKYGTETVALQAGKDFDIQEGTDLINAGSKTLTIEGKGNYTGTVTQTYTIEKAPLNASKVKVEIDPVAYDANLQGSDIKSAATVTDLAQNKEVLAADFEVRFKQANGEWTTNLVDKTYGTYPCRIYAASTGNFQNTDEDYVDAQYTVVKTQTLAMALSDATLAGNAFTRVDTDKVEKGFKITYDSQNKFNKTLSSTTVGNEFEVLTEDGDWTNAGTYKLTVKGLGNYRDEVVEIPVIVEPKELNSDATTLESGITVTATAGKTYGGATATPVVEVKDGTTVLKNGEDYTYTTKTELGVPYVVITGKGNYTTDVSTTVKTYKQPIGTSAKLDLNHESISAKVNKTFEYTGTDIQVVSSDITVVENDTTPHTLTKDEFLVLQDAYKTADGTKITGFPRYPGTYKATIKGKGTHYEGEREVEFVIKGQNFADTFALDTTKLKDTYSVSVTDIAQTVKDALKVVYKESGATYASANYKVAFYPEGSDKAVTDLQKTGTYTVKVTPKNSKYDGVLETTVKVVGTDIAAEIEIDAIKDQNYTGTAIEPALVIRNKKDSSDPKNLSTLVKDVDYSVVYRNNVKVGNAVVTVKGIGKYSGEVSVTFKITGEMDQKIEVLAAQERDLGNGTRTLNSKATKIKYTTAPETAVTYTSSDENVVTVDAEGNLKYTGLGEATITIEAKAENGYKAAKKEIKVVVKLAKPSFTPFSKNNAFTLTSSTVKGAEKFEVQYATKKNFSNAKTKTFTTTTAGKIRQVKVAAADKRTYYVRVRAVSGTTKSAWSGVKTVATK